MKNKNTDSNKNFIRSIKAQFWGYFQYLNTISDNHKNVLSLKFLLFYPDPKGDKMNFKLVSVQKWDT